MDKVIITAAVNGNRLDTNGCRIPVSPEEIGADALECFNAGAAVVHFHARDAQSRRSTADVGVFGDTIRSIRDKCEVLIETTTGIGPKTSPQTGELILDPVSGSIMRPSDDERLALIDLDPQQDLGTISAGSMNMHNPVYDKPSVFPNSPYYIDQSVSRMSRKPNMAFQFEIFDVGFLMNVERLVTDGTLDRRNQRFWLNYVLGFGGLSPSARHLSIIYGEGERLFPNVSWGTLAPGPEHFNISALGSALGADVLRTGFEDTIHLPNGEIAGCNARLVEALVKIVQATGREIASPDEARTRFGIATNKG